MDEEPAKDGMYEKNESLKTWETTTKRLKNEKTIEKFERVEGNMMMKIKVMYGGRLRRLIMKQEKKK